MRARAGVALMGALVLMSGCTATAEAVRSRASAGAETTTSMPGDSLTVVADGDPAASAVSTSRALFHSAGVAVVARDGDVAGTLMAASAAVGLGAPLLVTPPDGALTTDPVRSELDRLGARAVLVVGGDGSAPRKTGGRDVVAVPASAEAVSRATGLHLTDADPVGTGGQAAAVAQLDPGRPAALRPDGAGPPPAGRSGDPRLPEVDRPKPLTGLVVLANDSPEFMAGIATARAAGARVEVMAGQTDPRTSADVVSALADGATQKVLAVGPDFGGNDALSWEVATARTGPQLPAGGQTLFPGRMLVALYGTPGPAALGVLGEQDLSASIDRARQHAAQFDHLVDVPVVPTFEIIATIASSSAGPDGNYSSETDPETLRPWVEAARDAGVYVVLDLQPGRADFLTQAKEYQSLLELPNVGLALDPEWRLGPGEQPLQQIGSVGVDEVNGVAGWLAALTREQHLPQKLFVVHQFQLRMISGRDRLDTSHPELAVLVHADGQGGQGQKQGTWQALHQDLPPGPLSWGWKNFYDEDHPMLTPEQTIDQVHPRPDLISYQ